MGVDRDSKAGSTRAGDVLFDRYRVDSKIAEGGMSTVFRCIDLRTRNHVATKILHQVYNDKEVIRTRFIDEGRIQQMLSHPNIVDVYDVLESQDLLGIVMELVEGPTLQAHLEQHGTMSTETILRLMLPVLSAIGFAHSKGVIHRDIKPSNVLLKPRNGQMVPRVMDFGVAKLVRGKDLTATGTTVGTLHYMSPEQIVGSKDIDGRADIYSLGCTLYKLCTGDVPFNASTEFALMMAQVEAPPTPPSSVEASVPENLESVIMRCLAKRPEDRFPSVKDLTLAMLELRSGARAGDTNTIPISQELLDYAMNADEVAIDRTGVIDIAALDEMGGIKSTREEMRRVEIEDEPQLGDPTREMRFDPSIDKPDGEGEDLTLESSMDDFTTVPLSGLDANKDDPSSSNDNPSVTQPIGAVDKESDPHIKVTRPMESTTTTEFKPDKRWIEGQPSVDSREETRPRASLDTERSETDERDPPGKTTDEIEAADQSSPTHVRLFARPDLDALEEEAREPEGDSSNDSTDSSDSTELFVQIALLLLLFALVGAGVAIVMGYL